MRRAGHVSRVGEKRNTCGVLVLKPEGNRPLGTPRHRRDDSIKIDLKEVGLEGMVWIRLTQNKHKCLTVVNTVMDFWLT